jgi:hypothetical protein
MFSETLSSNLGVVGAMTHPVPATAIARTFRRAFVHSAIAAGLVFASSAATAQGAVTQYGSGGLSATP